MGIFSKVANFLGGNVLEGVKDIVDEVYTSDKERKELELKARQLDLREIEIRADLLTKIHETNIAEAQSKSLWVAGWRPFIGWVGGFALAYHFIFEPVIEWGVKIAGLSVDPPHLDTGYLMNLVLTMLGFGGLRTFEKLKGVHNKH